MSEELGPIMVELRDMQEKVIEDGDAPSTIETFGSVGVHWIFQ